MGCEEYCMRETICQILLFSSYGRNFMDDVEWDSSVCLEHDLALEKISG